MKCDRYDQAQTFGMIKNNFAKQHRNRYSRQTTYMSFLLSNTCDYHKPDTVLAWHKMWASMSPKWTQQPFRLFTDVHACINKLICKTKQNCSFRPYWDLLVAKYAANRPDFPIYKQNLCNNPIRITDAFFIPQATVNYNAKVTLEKVSWGSLNVCKNHTHIRQCRFFVVIMFHTEFKKRQI